MIPLQSTSYDIWKSKYRLTNKDGTVIDETIEDTYQRVAKALSEVEKTPESQQYWENKFYWALQNGAIPAGRILSNVGAQQYKRETSTINCVVSGTIEDSMYGILNRLQESGMTLKKGSGIGYEFSTLRPRGSYVAGAGATTSGPLSFMDIYDKMCFTISSAGGRRGAQMATFDVSHPDVLEFITAKRESGRLRQFNLSLLITDEFMQAVINDDEWTLLFPVSKEEYPTLSSKDIVYKEWPITDEYVLKKGQVACKVYQKLPARTIWNKIIESNYSYSEPGFILIDKVNEMNNNWFCENMRATNPCVTADTWIHTSDGPRQVSELIGKQFVARIDGNDYPSSPDGFFYTANKPVVTLKTTEGYSIDLTVDHRVRRISSANRFVTEWCEAGELVIGDKVLLNNHQSHIEWDGLYGYNEGYLIGLLIGDGTIKKNAAIISLWRNAKAANGNPHDSASGIRSVMEEALLAINTLPHRPDFSGWFEIEDRGEYRLSTSALRDLALSLGLSYGNKTITPSIERTSSNFYKGFLRGLFDTDGSVQGSQEKGVSIRLSQVDLQLLESVQRMLLRLGIVSTIYQDRKLPCSKLMPNGKGGSSYYQTRALHELVISKENLLLFNNNIGFTDNNKSTHLKALISSYKRKVNKERFVASISEIVLNEESQDVYDVSIPGINEFDANGFHAHNCGEQSLPPYGSCLLGSINLVHFVCKPFTSEAYFHWIKYREVISIFTRMLDNVVELNGLPLSQQRDEIINKRRHGMGYLGLGSALTMLGSRYGSEAAIQFTSSVTRELALTGLMTGLELAREKGPAPIMEQEFEITPLMMSKRPELSQEYRIGNKVKGKVLHAKYSRYMQKIAEVEPELVDKLAHIGCRFTHHTSIAPTGTIALSIGNNVSNGIEPSFAHQYSRNVIIEGKKSKEKVTVYSYELLAYRHLVDQNTEQLPECFVEADDVTPEQHIKMQAAAQQWVDSSISKTINIPTHYTQEDMKGIYLCAYEHGLKGCTTFRFNPDNFQGVLVRNDDLKNTTYCFVLEDGTEVKVAGDEQIDYDGEQHTAANLFDALKDGYYGKF